MDMEATKAHRKECLRLAVEKVSEGNKSAFGRFMGWKDGAYVGQLLRGERPITEELVAEIEAKPGLSHWFSPNRAFERGVAHGLSDLQSTLQSQIPTVEWRAVMQGELPPEFLLPVKDDSMSGVLELGDMVKFSTTGKRQVRPGRIVLVADAAGNAYIRRFRAWNESHWEAASTDDDRFIPLDSVRDGLQVLAVMKGIEYADDDS